MYIEWPILLNLAFAHCAIIVGLTNIEFVRLFPLFVLACWLCIPCGENINPVNQTVQTDSFIYSAIAYPSIYLLIPIHILPLPITRPLSFSYLDFTT